MSAPFIDRLNGCLADAGQPSLDPALGGQFERFTALLQKWNSRTNLTAIRDEEGILRRHLVESIVCAQATPALVQTLLDFGSGAGFPGIPIALCRPEIAVTLTESQGKKAAFLREAARELQLQITIHADRAEKLSRQYDCVTLRAVDRMERAVTAAASLVRPQGGFLCLLTTSSNADALRKSAGRAFEWQPDLPLGLDSQRVIALGRKSS